VNASRAKFTVEEGEILYALGGLKNVGLEAMRLIVEAREAGGPFADLGDLARRVELKAVGKRALEMLARAGAFDRLEPNRARALAALDRLVEYSAAVQAERASGQATLFGTPEAALPPPPAPAAEDWTPARRLDEEQAAVGFYLSGHPLDPYMPALARRGVVTHDAFLAARAGSGGSGRIAGAVSDMRVRKSARGTRFAFIRLSDPAGGYEVMAFQDVLAKYEELMEPGARLVLSVELEPGEETSRLMLRAAQPVEQVAADAAASGIRVTVVEEAAVRSVKARLDAGLAHGGGRGTGPVHLVLPLPERDEEVELALPGAYRLGPEMRAALKDAPGVAHVEEF
jgi:DNA polymerase-3 subunit alpha